MADTEERVDGKYPQYMGWSEAQARAVIFSELVRIRDNIHSLPAKITETELRLLIRLRKVERKSLRHRMILTGEDGKNGLCSVVRTHEKLLGDSASWRRWVTKAIIGPMIPMILAALVTLLYLVSHGKI